jgi:metal-responsive CopG/Arc/MetJ family transcriptional regulator
MNRWRRCFNLDIENWQLLTTVAVEMGYRSRNHLIATTVRKIIADHQQSKNRDLA